MKRVALGISVAALGFYSGCAAVDGNFTGSESQTAAHETASTAAPTYEPMQSMPPEAPTEAVPALSSKEVWVPGYFQPVAGTWLWHEGQVRPEKEGYRIVPASYRERDGQIFFTPPRWRRADLTEAKN